MAHARRYRRLAPSPARRSVSVKLKNLQRMLVVSIIFFAVGLSQVFISLVFDHDIQKAVVFGIVWLIPTGVWIFFSYTRVSSRLKDRSGSDEE